MADGSMTVAQRVETFRNENVSVSRLKLYEQCAYAFFLRYVEKLAKELREPRSIEADFGVVLHAALEALYDWIVREEYSGKFPLDELLAFYREVWSAVDERGGWLVNGGNVEMYRDGLNILRNYAIARGVVDCWDTLAVEQEFKIEIHGFTFHGFIDRIDRLGDDAIAIVDYKSNRNLFTRGELDSDLQMSLYGVAARYLYPWAKRVEFGLHMLRHNTIQTTSRTARAIDDGAGYLVSLGKKTESDTKWEARLNPNCSYCDYRRHCKTYQNAVTGRHEITRVSKDAGLDELATEREQVAAVAKAAYARAKQLDDVIRRKIDADGPFEAAGRHYSLQEVSERSYPMNRLIEVFQRVGVAPGELMRRVVSVGVGKVDELVGECVARMADGELTNAQVRLLKTELDAIVEKHPGTGRLQSKALKK